MDTTKIDSLKAEIERLKDIKSDEIIAYNERQDELLDKIYDLEHELAEELQKYYWSKFQKGGFYKWLNKNDNGNEEVYIEVVGMESSHYTSVLVNEIHKFYTNGMLRKYEYDLNQSLRFLRLKTISKLDIEGFEESSKEEFECNIMKEN